MTQWFAVCDRATGEAVSFGTVVADVLPDHLVVVPIAAQPSKSSATRWDAPSRSVVVIPQTPVAQRDRAAELMDDPIVSAILDKCTKAERLAFIARLQRLD